MQNLNLTHKDKSETLIIIIIIKIDHA